MSIPILNCKICGASPDFVRVTVIACYFYCPKCPQVKGAPKIDRRGALDSWNQYMAVPWTPTPAKVAK
jgi:hypothetical protein